MHLYKHILWNTQQTDSIPVATTSTNDSPTSHHKLFIKSFLKVTIPFFRYVSRCLLNQPLNELDKPLEIQSPRVHLITHRSSSSSLPSPSPSPTPSVFHSTTRTWLWQILSIMGFSSPAGLISQIVRPLNHLFCLTVCFVCLLCVRLSWLWLAL